MSDCRCDEPQMGIIYDPDKVGAATARKCDWRLIFFGALGALSGYWGSHQTRKKVSTAAWTFGGAAAGVASAYYLNHAVGSGLCAPDPEGLGNMWQMPLQPPDRADRYTPPPGQPGGTQAWRMPMGTEAGFNLPMVGSHAIPQNYYMPESFTPAPIPTPLRATWADVMSQ
jgi:hypothetical protein